MNTDGHKRSLAIPWQKHGGEQAIDGSASHRMPFLNKLPAGVQGHFVAMCGEFVGTFLFLFFALSATQVANTTDTADTETRASRTSTTLYISFAFGFSLVVNAWVFFRISGGLFNPAVTLAMCIIGSLSLVRAVALFISQLLGAISAAAVVLALFPGDMLASQTSLGGGTTVVQGLFIEMFLTAGLVFTIFMLATEKHRATFIAPLGIGLSLFIAQLSGVYYTGASLNPARTFGPAVANRFFHGYHWIYWLGPALGALVASGFYKFIKVLEYEMANPGQDGAADLEKCPDAEAGKDGTSPAKLASESSTDAVSPIISPGLAPSHGRTES